MKRRMVASLLVASAVASGCASNKKPEPNASAPPQYPPMNQAAADVPAQPPVQSAPPATYTPPPQAVAYDTAIAQQPVIEDAAVDASEPYVLAPTARRASGTRYTIRKGESLWSIAQTRYGNGQKWKTIAAANPSIDPNRIQAGQTIVLP